MSAWIPLLLFVGAGVAFTLFMRFALPEIRKRMIGDRRAWAQRNGGVADTANLDAFLDSVGRPGLLGDRTGKAINVVRVRDFALVDYTYLVTHEGGPARTWTERRLVTVAVGDLGREVPSVRVIPRTLVLRLSERMLFTAIRTGDAEFDQQFHLNSNQLASAAKMLAPKNVRELFRETFATDESGVLSLLSEPVRGAMLGRPRFTFEFRGRHLLIYRQWRLMSDRRLHELVHAWEDVAGAVHASLTVAQAAGQ